MNLSCALVRQEQSRHECTWIHPRFSLPFKLMKAIGIVYILSLSTFDDQVEA